MPLLLKGRLFRTYEQDLLALVERYAHFVAEVGAYNAEEGSFAPYVFSPYKVYFLYILNLASELQMRRKRMSQSQQVPKLVWLVTVLIAVILGIWPGIVVTLDHYTGLAALIGWVFVPTGIYDILHNLMTGQFHPDELEQFQQLMILAYPFAMVGYSLCASWTIRCTGVMHKGLLIVVVAAFVSALRDHSRGHNYHELRPTSEYGFLQFTYWLCARSLVSFRHFDPIADLGCAGMVDQCRIGPTP